MRCTADGGDVVVLRTVDASWRIDRISADVEQILGRAPADVVGQPVAALVDPGDWPSLLIELGHSLTGEVGCDDPAAVAGRGRRAARVPGPRSG
jgi:hypothetical protein